MNDKLKRSFDILEMSYNGTLEEAKQAWRDLALVWHPDKHDSHERLRGKATEKFKEINAAWDDVKEWFAQQEREQKDQENIARAAREKQAKDREAAEREEAERQVREEAKYEKFKCPHCKTVNRILRDHSVDLAKCGSCSKYLDKDREKEEKARLRKQDEEIYKKTIEENRKTAEKEERIRQQEEARQEDAKQQRFEKLKRQYEQERETAAKEREQEREATVKLEKHQKSVAWWKRYGWVFVSIMVVTAYFGAPIVQGQYAKYKEANEIRIEKARVETVEMEKWVAKKTSGFTLVNELIIVDDKTGLMWARNANISGDKMSWQAARNYVSKLNYAGYKDWRLPGRELLDFVKRGGPAPSKYFNGLDFHNVESYGYWTSSEDDDDSRRSWAIGMNDGYSYQINKTKGLYVWPVRGKNIY